MGKIDHKKLETLAYGVKDGKTENSQINTIDLTGNAGKIIIGANSSDKTYSHPDDLAKSYNIKNVFLSEGDTKKIFKDAPKTYSHELVIEMHSTDSTDDKMFIIFFVDPNVQNLSEDNFISNNEFKKLNDNKNENENENENDATNKEIDLSLLINENYQNAFFMDITVKGDTSKIKVILFEEPIKTKTSVLIPNQIPITNPTIVGDVKYYAGGTYYTECTVQGGGEDSDTSVTTPSTSDVKSPSIDWDKYLPYILAVACGILMILIVVTLGAGGKKFGDKFSNIITEAINKLSIKKEGAADTSE